MTKLILAPFDPAAPGSHAHRMRMLDLVDEYGTAQTDNDVYALARIARKINLVVVPRLRTDDGTPVEAALADISADQYDLLVGGLFAQGAKDAVPLASTPGLTDGHAASLAPKRRRGRARS